MMDGGSLGRHGSSGSCLDGVPFKIGPKFRPPPKIIYQPVMKSSCTSQGSKEEYTFKTEEGVLAWAKAREEALKKATVEQEEKAAKAAACVKSNDESIESDEQNRGGGKPGNTNNNGKDTSPDTAIHQQNKVKPPVPTKPPTQKVISEPGAILKPTPIQPLNKVIQQNGSDSSTNPAFNSAFDVSMFERVDDPFETLELQTINDMEELKVVLNSSSSKDNKESIENENSDTSPQNSNNDLDTSEGIYDLAAPVMSAWVTFNSDGPFSNVQEQKGLKSDTMTFQESARSSESPASDTGEYVDIVDEKGVVTFKPVSGVKQDTLAETARSDQLNSNSNALSGPLSKSNTASAIYRPVLPPISASHMKMFNGNGDVKTNSLEQNNSNPFLNSTSLAASTNSESHTNENTLSTNIPKPVRLPPPPPSKPNRPVPIPRPRPNSSGQMWSSAGPSLADSLESSPNSSEGQIHNPYSRHSMNQSDPDLSEKFSELTDKPSESPVSQLNKYRPLPPTPSPRPFVEKGNQSIGLTDPYISLSRDAQVFTDRITSMGFLRAKVARAVEKFGEDEKEVFDHLFAVDVLVEKKYAPIHAEAALHSCKNDVEKAEHLLELQSQLEQLGFSSESVRDALVQSNMDHDKALDLLTA